MKANETVETILLTVDLGSLFPSGEAEKTKFYRKLVRLTHPDVFVNEDDKAEAAKAFSKLNDWWNSRNSVNKGKIKTRKHEYLLLDKFSDEDGFVVYKTSYDAGHRKAFLSYSKNSKNNDLVRDGFNNLKKIRKEVPKEFKIFFPEPLENFRDSNNGKEKVINTYSTPDMDFFTLSEVQDKYTFGVDPKDVAWMFRRMIVAVGNAHDVGFVHCSPNLNAFLIQPEYHGIVLTNWQYSVPIGESIKALPVSQKKNYQSWVFENRVAKPEIDFNIIAKTALSLLGSDAPKPMVAFLKGCLTDRLPAASGLLEEFDEMLERLWGEKKFHVFSMN